MRKNIKIDLVTIISIPLALYLCISGEICGWIIILLLLRDNNIGNITLWKGKYHE